jgi:nucleoside-diphosphate-sugar epimerase
VTDEALTVAVTGPTGTFGAGLLPLLEADDRVASVVGVARRPWDPSGDGYRKVVYRRGDVRDTDALAEAFSGADVVVHLAFQITGTASRQTIRAINVDGTVNAFRAAAAAGVRRFVYASSVAAYGFFPDNPVGMTEEWPVRPAAHLFYAQEKAELEQLLARESAEHPEIDLYLLRPPIVVGPHAVGAKLPGPELLGRVGGGVLAALIRLPIPLPVPSADIRLQLIHERDVGQALLLCAVGAGPAGAYNIAGEGEVSVADVLRELGMLAVPLPTGLVQRVARTIAGLPGLPAAAGWAEAFSQFAIMDTTKARRELGWAPQWSALEALRDTLPTSRGGGRR